MRRYRVQPGARVDLAAIDPDDTGGLGKKAASDRMEKTLLRLRELNDVFYADHRFALLIVLQAMDTAGKDGTINHVFSGLNPSGCVVASFKVPTDVEKEHDFLWRIHPHTPRLGHITIFNRSHYVDVIVPKVHRTLPDAVIDGRYDHINAFERLLVDNATTVVKFYLHISKEEQANRLLERLDDPSKHWKFSVADLHERKLWSRYMRAYEKTLSRCSTREAPWYVIPANHKWYRNYCVAEVLRATLEGLRCRYPKATLSAAEMRRLRRELA